MKYTLYAHSHGQFLNIKQKWVDSRWLIEIVTGIRHRWHFCLCIALPGKVITLQTMPSLVNRVAHSVRREGGSLHAFDYFMEIVQVNKILGQAETAWPVVYAEPNLRSNKPNLPC